ncbi:hypothetical protein ACFQZR_12890 [Paenibacillus sp. GCM10027629]|uniref:hypothetical protein n=1 Tax=Paenibacillus sp. GCM10027629 TaxID=3273414 RepID=UPI00364090AB
MLAFAFFASVFAAAVFVLAAIVSAAVTASTAATALTAHVAEAALAAAEYRKARLAIRKRYAPADVSFCRAVPFLVSDMTDNPLYIT